MTLLNRTASQLVCAPARRAVNEAPWNRRSGNPLDIRAQVGVASSPLSLGSQAITGVAFRPKAVIPFGGPSNSAGTAINGAIIGLGAGLSSSNRACVAVSSDNGVTTSDTDRRHDNSKIFTTLSSIGNVLEACDLTSIDASGFTLNWTTIDPNTRIFNHICLGGADLEVSLTLQQMNGTNASQSFAHGLSGPPTGLFVFATHSDIAPPTTQTTSAMSIGSWSSSGQWVSNVWSNNGMTNTEVKRTLADTAICRFNTGSTHTIIRALTVGSVDATNVNCTYSVTTSAAQAYFYMLAVRGAKCQTGTFDCNGSLSPLAIGTPGIAPKLFFAVALPECVDNMNTIKDSINLSLWASDGTSNVSCGITDLNGQTTTNTKRHQYSSKLSEITASTGAQQFEGTASFDGQSVVLTPTLITSSSFGQGAYLVIGA